MALAYACGGGVSVLYFGSSLLGINSSHISIVGFLVVALMIVLWRRDLLRDAIASGVFLMALTICIYAVWLHIFPHAFTTYWELHNLSGFSISGIPVEELLYLFAWGTVIGPLYELMAGLRMRDVTAVKRTAGKTFSGRA